MGHASFSQVNSFCHGTPFLGEAADHWVQLQLHSCDRKLEPGRASFRGARMPHPLPEATKSRRTHTSPAPRSPCLKPFPMRFSSASPALHRSPGPFALRSLVPASGRVCSETREASGRSQCRPHGVRTRRAATCSTKPGVCASAGYSRKDPVIPSVRNAPGSPKARIAPSPSAHSPSRNPGGSHRSVYARRLTSRSPRSSPDPSAGCQGPYHSRPLREDRAPKYLP